MWNYELRPLLTYCKLVGQDEDGDLEFWGTNEEWKQATDLEIELTKE